MKPKLENTMTTLGISLVELSIDIMEIILSEDRTTIIDKILELAGDEYESKDDLTLLAKKELSELKDILFNVYDYYAKYDFYVKETNNKD